MAYRVLTVLGTGTPCFPGHPGKLGYNPVMSQKFDLREQVPEDVAQVLFDGAEDAESLKALATWWLSGWTGDKVVLWELPPTAKAVLKAVNRRKPWPAVLDFVKMEFDWEERHSRWCDLEMWELWEEVEEPRATGNLDPSMRAEILATIASWKNE